MAMCLHAHRQWFHSAELVRLPWRGRTKNRPSEERVIYAFRNTFHCVVYGSIRYIFSFFFSCLHSPRDNKFKCRIPSVREYSVLVTVLVTLRFRVHEIIYGPTWRSTDDMTDTNPRMLKVCTWSRVKFDQLIFFQIVLICFRNGSKNYTSEITIGKGPKTFCVQSSQSLFRKHIFLTQ